MASNQGTPDWARAPDHGDPKQLLPSLESCNKVVNYLKGYFQNKQIDQPFKLLYILYNYQNLFNTS